VWRLDVRDADGAVSTMSANVLVSGSGYLSYPRELDIPGVEDFRGDVLHTTRWGKRTAAGKRVAIIGNGSTGVQLLARVADDAEHVDVYQRTAQWISPRDRYGELMSAEHRWLLDNMPYYWNWSRYSSVMPQFEARRFVETDHEWIARGGYVNELNDKVREGLTAYIKAQVGGRQDLIDKLIPDYAPLARRPVVDNGWYRALTRDNVELITTPIERLSENGIVTADGVEHEADMILAAIGFQVTKYLAPATYIGRGGLNLHEFWENEGQPRAYLGMTVPGFPNLFILYGPNSQPISGGASLPTWLEIWSHYIGESIVAMIEKDIASLEVKQERVDDYYERLNAEAAGLVYLTDTGSRDANYYVHNRRLVGNAPWQAEHYYAWCNSPSLDDFVIAAIDDPAVSDT
jgi:4-hydroxyacetophenone monooxygenase